MSFNRRQFIANIGSLSGGSSSQRSWATYTGERDGTNTVIKSSAISGRPKAKQISSTKFAVMYQLSSSTGALELVIIDESTGTIGTPVEVKASGHTIRRFGVEICPNGDVTCFYSTDTGGGGQTIKNYTISGTTPTIDATLVVNSSVVSATESFSFAWLSSTRGFTLYYNGSALKITGVTRGSGSLTKDGSDASSAPTVFSNSATFMYKVSATEVALVFPEVAAEQEAGLITDGSPVVFGTPTSGFLTIAGNAFDSGFAMNEALDGGVISSSDADGSVLTFGFASSTITNGLKLKNPGRRGVAFLETDSDGNDFYLFVGVGSTSYGNLVSILKVVGGDKDKTYFAAGKFIEGGSNQTASALKLTTKKGVVVFRDASNYPNYRVINI
jgi:hypothetical protein